MGKLRAKSQTVDGPAVAPPEGQDGPAGAEPSKTAGSVKQAVHPVVDCGWGNLIFGQTFERASDLAEQLQQEKPGRRDVAFYVRDPHVVLAQAPHALFLDPSHTFRLGLAGPLIDEPCEPAGLGIRPARAEDERAVNAIYGARGMVPLSAGYLSPSGHPGCVTVLVAEDETSGIVGVVMGVDHQSAFDDPEKGSSLWSLAVDVQAKLPGIGRALIARLAEHLRAKGAAFMDLSVMYDNADAMALYRKLGFEQVQVFCVKKKNPINERLFVGPELETKLNVYAQIIIDEARRRGIGVEIEDAEAGLFTLTHGGRRIACRESLSDLTSAVAMSRCEDKTLTHRLLARAGLKVPAQRVVTSEKEAIAFLEQHGSIVVKPARGEQGTGVFVDLRSGLEVRAAIRHARELCDRVVLETYVEGVDLRIIVIGGRMVAAAIRRPASVVGDGTHTVYELIEKQSRRRSAATRGESRIPVDSETERCVHSAGHRMSDVLAQGEVLPVRKTANLHTGGTIHDVTEEVHPTLVAASERAAAVLDMPVVGLDLIVPDVAREDYVIIEANERPGLANHEPAPTAERFVDLLFPQTKG